MSMSQLRNMLNSLVLDFIFKTSKGMALKCPLNIICIYNFVINAPKPNYFRELLVIYQTNLLLSWFRVSVLIIYRLENLINILILDMTQTLLWIETL